MTDSELPETECCAMNADNISLDDPQLYFNRELSWLKFNKRILEEAEDPTQPLLERVKFLAICGNNMDEFFMSRISTLRHQAENGALNISSGATTPYEQLEAIREEVCRLNTGYFEVWNDLKVQLAQNGIYIHKIADLSAERQAQLREFFENNVYPILTPLSFDSNHPFPFVSGGFINLAIVVSDKSGNSKFTRVKVPGKNLVERFIRIEEKSAEKAAEFHLVMVEDLIMSNLDLLFPGMVIEKVYQFRVMRDAEFEIEVDETTDILTAVEEGLESRFVGEPVRLEVSENTPDNIIELLAWNLKLPKYLIYKSQAPLALNDFWQIHGIRRAELMDTPFQPYTPRALTDLASIVSKATYKDIMLYHPYDSFQPVVDLIRKAAEDPNVMAIKITFYRVDAPSPRIDALVEARRSGKAVAVVLELKAKFDETNNISWARRLEQAGVHVVYGPVGLKIHAKLCMIVYKTRNGIKRICHLSSGNYNTQTAKIYGDIGYITCNPDIASDVSKLFNSLTGYCVNDGYKKLLVSPDYLRSGMMERIEREIKRQREHGDGYLGFKLNALVDRGIIRALYRASMAGVKIDLNVRGMCCLRPGIPGVSENIRVISIVSRFLEHARIYYFRNGGEEEVLLGSSDMMPRNLDRRVEELFPVEDEQCRKAAIEILKIHLADNVKARELQPNGEWVKRQPQAGEERIDSQVWLAEHRGVWHGEN